jgi:DNA polymerase III subunit alpha
VLERAQAAGQQVQLDAQIGQGSIFDLGGLGGESAERAFAPAHPPIPPEEYDRPELLAMEKESIGLFITEHPLKRVREALRVKADCGCAQVAEQKDGDWVKVGGMITESKKIRTRTGTSMMFATLDDLDGAVEIVVFEKALDAVEKLLATDAIVLVRGRVDHKEAGKSCVIVQDAERFDPTEKEIEKAKEQVARIAAEAVPNDLRRRVDAARLQPTIIEELRDLFDRYPGDAEFVLEMHTRTGVRYLRFGGDYKIASRNGALTAELDRLLGPAPAPPVPAPAAA